MAMAETGCEGLIGGLELIRRAERERLRRRLHDDIGPALCSAGLMAGLVRASVPPLHPEAASLLDQLQSALESAVESVRALSDAASADLAARCGLAGAVARIARLFGAACDAGAPPLSTSSEQASAICRAIYDALLALDPPLAAQCAIALTPLGARIAGPGRLPAAAREAILHIASAARLDVRFDQPADSVCVSITIGEDG